MNHSLSTRTVARGLFGLAIILLPFNSLPYFGGVFGEMAGEGAFYPLAVGLLICGLELACGDRLSLSGHPSAYLLGLFIMWVLASVALNLPWVVAAETKGRTGPEKALLQVVLLVFAAVTALLVYQIASRQANALVSFRRWALVSFLISGAYAAIEIASFVGISSARALLAVTNPLIMASADSEVYFSRMRSVSGEASWFAMYCSLVFPWIFSYLLTEKRRGTVYVMLVVYLLALVTLTWSRTAYFITSIQLCLLLGFTVLNPERSRRRARVFILAVGAVIATSSATIVLRSVRSASFSPMAVFSSLLSLNGASNLGRIGSQVAAYRIAIDHPIVGIGFGQYGFRMPAYVPLWAKGSYEVPGWMSTKPGTRWPPVHSIYARVAAEAGFIGLIIWLAVWFSLLTSCYRQYRRSCRLSKRHDALGLALIVSIVGVMLSGFNQDSFRFFGYWIMLGLGWTYLGHASGPALAQADSAGPTLHSSGVLSSASP